MSEQERRELNRRVAVEVMGAAWIPHRNQLEQEDWLVLPDGELMAVREAMSNEITWDVIPGYSTDIAAAWQVVERMRELGYSVAVIVTPDGVMVEIKMPAGTVTITKPDTVGEGVCLAALAALGKGEA